MRYQYLLHQKIEIEGIPLRVLAREIGVNPSSLHNYVSLGMEPRRAALEKMSAYFGETVAQLLSEDDDLTARLIAYIRSMGQEEKQALLDHLSNPLGHIWAKSSSDKK